jgi:hypothetical protein
MSKVLAERLVASALILISIYFWWKASGMPQRSGIFPIFTAAGVILLSLGIIARSYFVNDPRLAGNVRFDFSYTAMKPIYVMIVAVAYSYSVFKIGFYVSSFIFYFLATYMVGLRNYKIILLVAIILFPFTYLFFTVGLGANLPKGMLM